jgi:DNA-binding NarL/FixJ family response regulator
MSVRMPCQYTGLPSSPRTILSSRQKEILGLVGEGLSNAQIAERLFLSESTINSTCAPPTRSSAPTIGQRP